MPADDTKLDAELQAHVAAGRKIEAIRRYRELTGDRLKEAKDAVEALMRDASLSSREPAEVPFEAEIISLLHAGDKIAAIKLYRDRAGVVLKDAKDFIETLATDRRIAAPTRSGCLGLALLVAAVVATCLTTSCGFSLAIRCWMGRNSCSSRTENLE